MTNDTTDNPKKELEELSPLLSKMKQEHPGTGFTVPEGYFDALSAEILGKLPAEATIPPVPQHSWRQKLDEWLLSLFQPRLALAFATVALLLTAAWWALRPASTADASLATVVSDEELLKYIQNNLDEFDLDLLTGLAESAHPSVPLLPEEENLDPLLEELLDELDPEQLETLF